MFKRKPIVSIILFDEFGDQDITNLINSIESLDPAYRSKIEFIYVIYNGKLREKSNETKLFFLRQFMPAKFMDYSERYGKDNLKCYTPCENILVKKGTDVVTLGEIEKYFK